MKSETTKTAISAVHTVISELAQENKQLRQEIEVLKAAQTTTYKSVENLQEEIQLLKNHIRTYGTNI